MTSRFTDRMNSIVVHYKELALKGRNRPWFVQLLVRNLRAALDGLDVATRPIGDGPHRDRARRADASWAEVRDARSRACSASPTSRTPAAAPHDFDALAAAILGDLGDRERRVVSRQRAPRRQALSVHVAADRARSRRPDQGGAGAGASTSSDPALTIHIEMLPEHAFYFFGKEPGAGGLPTGTGGRRRVPAVGRHRFAGRGVPDDAARLLGAARSTFTAIRSCRARRRRRCARSRRC